jgi:hypothetical protein
VGNLSGCNAQPDKCPIPTYCNDGKGEHLCLYIFFMNSETEFDYSTIYKAKVTHSGTDCNNNSYYCSYITGGSNPTAMGAVLPWCSTNCSYLRSVCIETYDRKIYSGSTSFSYPLPPNEVVRVYVYETIGGKCDFGGVEFQED